jgi:hypothetical protein
MCELYERIIKRPPKSPETISLMEINIVWRERERERALRLQKLPP